MRIEHLLERGEELATASALLDAVGAGEGRLLLIEGAPGIGKTQLLRAIRAAARERGADAPSARGSELERQSPFGVVRALLEPRVAAADEETRAALFTGAAAGARKLFDPRGTSDEDEVFDLLHALSWLVVNLSQQGPMALLVDDAQWLDSPSARFLSYLADRLEDAPILLVIALRPDEPEAPRALERLGLHPDATSLTLAPLSRDAVATMAQDAFGVAPTEAFEAACHGSTGGNPFAVRSLLVDLEADGARPDDDAAAGLSDRVPAEVERALRLRLESVGEEAARLAGAVAVLGDGCALGVVARLAGLEPDTAADLADLLARVDILGPGRELTFTHPLARSAVYRAMAPSRRSTLHEEAARELSAAAAPERVALHLLEVEPAGDPAVVDTLRAAARGARSLGGRGAAIAFLRRALAEPPSAEQRFGTLVALGSAEVQAWNPAGVEHLREALPLAPDPVRRAEIAMVLAGAHRGASDFTGAAELLDAELQTLGDADADMSRILESELLHNAAQGASAYAALKDRPRPDPETLAGETRGERRLLMVLAIEALTSGEPRERGLELARRALRGAPPIADEPPGTTIVLFPVAGMIEAGAHEEITPVLDWMVDDARRQGSLVGYISAATFRGHARRLAGDLDGAEADAVSSWSLLRETPGALNAAQALGVLIDVLVARGDIAGAEAELAESGLADAPAAQMNLLILAAARLRLRLAQRRWDDALAECDLLDEASLAVGVQTSGTMERGPNRALALLGLGRADEAAVVAVAEVERAQRYGAPYALSAAQRALGLALGDERGTEHLAAAAESAEDANAPLHLARALLDHGAALRRAGSKRDARDPLRRALDLAAGCGAHGMEDEARTELLATGARPRRAALSGVASLTARERGVARLAADGLSNPEIAQALFITRKTVEKHVGEVLRKLDLRSREEVADAIREPVRVP